MQIVDAARVRFHLNEPWPDFMTFYGTSASGVGWIVPRKYVERVGDEGFKKAPIGAGSYKFVSFNPGVELIAEAVDGYWRKRPAVKRLVFKVMPEDTTRAAALCFGGTFRNRRFMAASTSLCSLYVNTPSAPGG